MSDNRKAFENWWNEVNPEPNRTKRVQYTDAYTCFIAGYKAAATEQSSKEIERLNALVSMQAEALKFYADCRHFVQHQDVWELVIGEPISFFENNTAAIEDGSTAKQALSASSSTVAKWEAAHAAKMFDKVIKFGASEREVRLVFANIQDRDNFLALVVGAEQLRSTKVKE